MKVLVLGANSGIARAVVLEVLENPPDGPRSDLEFRLCARQPEILDSLVSRIESGGASARRHACDALGSSDRERILAELKSDGPPPDLVLAAWGMLLDEGRSDGESLDRMSRVNHVSTVEWVRALAEWMDRESAGGTIAVLGSVAGDRPRRRRPRYSESKQLLERDLAALRAELQVRGERAGANRPRILLVKPGPVLTPMTAGLGPIPLMVKPEVVAVQILRAVARGCTVCYTPRRWRPVMALLRRLPEWLWQRINI